MNQEYCAVCEKNVNYEIKEKKYLYEDENTKFEYNGKVAVCTNCGEILFVNEIEKYNQECFKQEYKKVNNIITSEEIKEMLKKYNIGKRPLSLLLGFGEITLTRYLEGYIPTPKNSQKLKKYLNNPDDYYSLLLVNKKTISDVAFKKSKEATEKLLNPNKEEVLLTQVSNYIASKIEVTNLSLQKLLYYIQLFHLAFKGEPLFNATCKAWTYGPVFGKIYYMFKDYGYKIIEESEEINLEISQESKEIIDKVIAYFGCYSGTVLKSFTHTERPFKETQQNQIIEKELLNKFAKEIKEKYKLNNIDDIEKYSKEKFKEYINNI